MRRTPASLSLEELPEELRVFAEGAQVLDSSCSQTARVYLLQGREDCFLKVAPGGTLKNEAEMTRFFHGKGLAPEVLAYCPGERDWLVTRRICGEDCVFFQYLENPKRLCDTLAALLRQLHETEASGCPVPDRLSSYRETARRNYEAGKYDAALFPPDWGFSSREEAWHQVETGGRFLRPEVLLHGDYCLPNIILDKWRFSGFVDLDCAGVGDRHIDLFWGVWTLFYNLKTNAYYDRFLDVYGRDKVEPEKLRTVAAFEVFG